MIYIQSDEYVPAKPKVTPQTVGEPEDEQVWIQSEPFVDPSKEVQGATADDWEGQDKKTLKSGVVFIRSDEYVAPEPVKLTATEGPQEGPTFIQSDPYTAPTPTPAAENKIAAVEPAVFISSEPYIPPPVSSSSSSNHASNEAAEQVVFIDSDPFIPPKEDQSATKQKAMDGLTWVSAEGKGGGKALHKPKSSASPKAKPLKKKVAPTPAASAPKPSSSSKKSSSKKRASADETDETDEDSDSANLLLFGIAALAVAGLAWFLLNRPKAEKK